MAVKKAVQKRSWKHRFHENMHTLKYTSCLPCRRMAHFGLLHQRQQLRALDSPSFRFLEQQSKRLSGSSAGTERYAPAPKPISPVKVVRAASEPAQKPQSPKKRKLSKDESAPSKPEPEAKRSKVNIGSVETKHEGKVSTGEVIKPKQPNAIKQHTQQDAIKPKQLEATKSKQPDTAKLTPKSQSEPTRKRSLSDASSSSAISKAWPPKVGAPKIKGLSNPGNYCYRRSVLQSILCVPQLLNLITTSHPRCNKPCVTCALGDLATAYHHQGVSVSRALAAFDLAIRQTGRKSDPRWTATTPHTQEDAHEFLLYLLETVEKGRGIPKSAFQGTYKIKHRATWTCAHCNKAHVNDTSNPPSVTLQVPIPKTNSPTLAACIEAQHRETGTLIRCDGCKKQAKRTRDLLVSSAPDVLTIHLKRFEFDGRRLAKNARHVEIPELLDLAPWAVDSRTKNMRYRLQAVVLQIGSLDGGHYVAGVRSPNGAWTRVSDSHTSAAQFRELVAKKGESPYILTYTKVAGEVSGSERKVKSK